MIPTPEGMIFYFAATLYSATHSPLPELFDTTANPSRLDSGDFDNDGVEDIAVLIDHGAGTTLNEASIFYPDTTCADTPMNMIAVMKGQVFEGVLDLTFEIGLHFPAWVTDIKVADIDGDNNLDIVGIGDNPLSRPSYLFVWPGLGGFEFGEPVGYILGGPPLRMAVADFDGDTHSDVAVLLPMQNEVVVYLNDGGSGLGDPGISFPVVEYE